MFISLGYNQKSEVERLVMSHCLFVCLFQDCDSDGSYAVENAAVGEVSKR